ncbi:MAG: hypothetical protein J6S14_15815 [Clostridia bacterium]|nr:hypothetical protein [Clostridia bacterium]
MRSEGTRMGFAPEHKETSNFGHYTCDFWNTDNGCGKSYDGKVEEASYSLPGREVHIWIYGDNLSVTRSMGDGYYMEWNNDDEMALIDSEWMNMLDLRQILRSFPSDPFSGMVRDKMLRILQESGVDV